MTQSGRNPLAILVVVLAAGLAACGDGATSGSGAGEVPLPATQPVAAPVADGCITDPRAGRQTLECAGLSFELSVPEACLERACGLIVDVHGFGMNGFTEDLHTQLADIGGRAGFVVLQPSAPIGDGGFSSWSGSDDARVPAIVNRLMRVFHLMDTRVHMTGYSQGGFMTWRFLCDRPEIFGSVAPLSAGSGSCFDRDLPAEQVDILYAHGSTDGLVDFATATTTVERILDRWSMTRREVVSQDAGHTWTRYANDRGTRFEFIQFEWETSFVLGPRPLRGHCFPGSDQFVGCGSDTSFHWGEEVTRFFLAHPRSRA